MNKVFLEKISFLISSGEPFVQVTLIDGKGSIPQVLGAKMLVTKDGYFFGTIGGGKIEWHSINVAKEFLLTDQKIKYYQWNLQTDIKMTCGGTVTMLFEKILPVFDFKVAIFGAGHVCQALVKILSTLDCQIDVVDSRNEWLQKINSNQFDKSNVQCHLLDNPSEFVEKLSADTFLVSMTMGHATDLPILKKALELNHFNFVGVIGSHSKSIVLKKDLKELGIESDRIDQLTCPIGEPFGNNQPSEIAISITAQILKHRDFLLNRKT